MARREEFHMEHGEGVDGEFLSDRGYLYVMPQSGGFDGAFAARMRRV